MANSASPAADGTSRADRARRADRTSRADRAGRSIGPIDAAGAAARARAAAGGRDGALPAVIRTVDLSLDTDAVWALVADAEGLGAWLGHDVALDARPGGAGHVLDGDGTWRSLRVELVERGRSLAFRWWADGDPASESQVTFELVSTETGTRLTVIEQPVAPITRSGARACAWRDAADTAWDPRLLLLGASAHVLAHARGTALLPA